LALATFMPARVRNRIEVGFELSHHGQDIEEQPPDWIVGVVHGAAEVETHLSDRELVGNRPCIREGAGPTDRVS